MKQQQQEVWRTETHKWSLPPLSRYELTLNLHCIWQLAAWSVLRFSEAEACVFSRMQVDGIRSEWQATGEWLRRWLPPLDLTGMTDNKRMSKHFVARRWSSVVSGVSQMLGVTLCFYIIQHLTEPSLYPTATLFFTLENQTETPIKAAAPTLCHANCRYYGYRLFTPVACCLAEKALFCSGYTVGRFNIHAYTNENVKSQAVNWKETRIFLIFTLNYWKLAESEWRMKNPTRVKKKNVQTSLNV